MPEEKATEAEAPKSSKKKSGLIVAAILLVAAAGGGLATYTFVVAPMFAESEAPPSDKADDTIPPNAVAYDFDEQQVGVRQEDANAPASVLMYSVSFICANPETQLIIDKNKQWFVAKLAELHRNRTKTELTDPQVEKEITRMALEEANSLLRRLQKKPDPAICVIEVLHLKYSVFDL
jgi:flagellar basal body-associated protein FliL